MATSRAGVGILVGLAMLCAAPAPPAATGTRRALLIGIDDYASDSIRDLKGCGNDVDLMRSVLIGSFDFEPENVTVLKDGAATHDAIVKSIRDQLVAKSTADDIVLLHFSGHGSQVRDVSGDEVLDGKDETLVPHDARLKDVFDITDDEMNGLMRELSAKTPNAVFILDSCHSGSGGRGGAEVRSAPEDERTPPSAPDYALGTRGASEGPSDFRPPGANYALIYACRPLELSNESEFGGQRHGALTFFLAQALRQAGDDSTYRDVVEVAGSQVTQSFASQHPDVEGSGADSFVFGTTGARAMPYVLVDPGSGGAVQVQGGTVTGIQAGSVLNVYPRGTRDFAAATPSARVQIDHATAFGAQGHVVGAGKVQPLSLGVPEAPAFGTWRTKVFVDGATSSPLLQQIASALAKERNVRLTEDPKEANLLLRVADGRIHFEGADLQPLSDPLETGANKVAAKAVTRVTEWARWFSIRELANPASRVTVDFALWRAGSPETGPAPEVVAPGESVTYRVTNRSGIPLYLIVLDVSSDGTVEVLYPFDGSSEEELASKPEGFSDEIEFFVPDGRDHVRDVVKVLVTKQPVDPGLFKMGLRSGDLDEPNALEEMLETWMLGSRGAKSKTVAADAWATRQIALRVERPTAKVASYALHFDVAKDEAAVRAALSAPTRAVCDAAATPGADGCFQARAMDGERRMIEVELPEATRGEGDGEGVGKAFDEAYELGDRAGARRAEPLFELDLADPHAPLSDAIGTRGGDSDEHDEDAKKDDRWNLALVRAEPAWEKVRAVRNVPEGREASGIVVAHPDTGYREHAEVWNDDGDNPIYATVGRNYYERGKPPFDPMLDTRLLDDPAHGTASGSVIVSPPGCQLEQQPGCVNGLGRGARLVPLRVNRSVVNVSQRHLSQAILDVAEHRLQFEPQIISIAMGGPPTWSLWKATEAARRKGILVVAAAGNNVRYVVWPARFDSVIAVAAVNVRCKPWSGSSHGGAVDISAPGESVWRASVNDGKVDFNGMGKGTTFSTGHVSGIAALWMARWAGDPVLEAARNNGAVSSVFRKALEDSAWQPADAKPDPPGTHCDADGWHAKEFGPGIIDAAALMDEKPSSSGLPAPAAGTARDLDTLPLFASLYPPDTPASRVEADYRALFDAPPNDDLAPLARFESEVLHHYARDEDVAAALDAVVDPHGSAGSRAAEPSFERAREMLARRELSTRLRDALE